MRIALSSGGVPLHRVQERQSNYIEQDRRGSLLPDIVISIEISDDLLRNLFQQRCAVKIGWACICGCFLRSPGHVNHAHNEVRIPNSPGDYVGLLTLRWVALALYSLIPQRIHRRALKRAVLPIVSL
jgi:hypothetical protein